MPTYIVNVYGYANDVNIQREISVSTPTLEIDFDLGQDIILLMSDATSNLELTFLNPRLYTCVFEVRHGVTARNITFPLGTLQAGGGGRTVVGVANSIQIIAAKWNGTNWLIATQTYS